MNSYLYVKTQEIPILLDGNAVHEIVSPESCDADLASSHIEWRDSVLPIVNMRKVLEVTESASLSDSVGVVYHVEKEQLVFLVVDHVEHLVKLNTDEFSPLCGIPKRTAEYFDGVYCEQSHEKSMAYHLRHPLPAHLMLDGGHE